MIGHSPTDVVFEHNTASHDGNVIQAHGKRNGTAAPIEHFVFRDNLLKHNRYGVIGDSLGTGNSTLGAYFPGAVFERNVLAGGRASQYPAGNYFPSVEEFEAAFVNAAEANFALVTGSPFRTGATNGGALGADLVRMTSAAHGIAPMPAAGGAPTALPIPGSVPTSGDDGIDEPWTTH
jgi:hypothetical protein